MPVRASLLLHGYILQLGMKQEVYDFPSRTLTGVYCPGYQGYSILNCTTDAINSVVTSLCTFLDSVENSLSIPISCGKKFGIGKKCLQIKPNVGVLRTPFDKTKILQGKHRRVDAIPNPTVETQSLL